MAMDQIRLRLIGKLDRDEKEYYFTCPKVPALVDLSEVVIFVHPDEDEEAGTFGADLVIKAYDKKDRRDKE